jgi:ribosomal protein S18 acetylase RimI-like enzyme
MSESNDALAVSLRTANPEDEQFLFEVYSSTRADELAQVGWNEAQLRAFLRMQFDLQQRIYGAAAQRIILAGEKPVGRLVVLRNEEEHRLADIALLPEHRSVGIGSTLIKKLLAEAAREKKPLRLQVEKFNEGARRLYERLGFVVTGESGTHFQMEHVGS